jgi:macrolide resistance protein
MTQLGQARRPSVKQDEIPGHNRLLHQLPLYGVMSAAGFSRLGNAVVGVALPWLVLDITGSAALTGVAAAAATGPLVIGAFFGGPLIDRLGARIVAVITLVAPGLWLLVCAATLGLATGALGPLLNTLFLRRAPAKIRGSVFGASTAAALSATPVAVLFAGVAVEVVGPTSVLWVLAGAMALLTAVATVAPALRRLSPAMI